MPRGAAALLWLVWLAAVLVGVPAAAQIPPPRPPGPYAIDVRAVSGAIPQDASFFPPAPTGTLIPSRGFGVDIGGHVYLMQLGPARVGVGATLLRLRGTAGPPTPPSSPGSSTPAAPRTIPDVQATLTSVAPQISFNFGTADGWSYLSAGLGATRLSTATSGTPTAATRDAGTLSTLNVGGGARWFAYRRLAFTFDVRFHLLSAGYGDGLAAPTPRATLIAASAGISLR